ncbi:HGxxPAAW family protein [Streptomyces sp. NPDC091271]|uniref:HGxxPAAW family protein n=1 Tax=Streptomyces sp. NPDC091271 TaxID=3365980 RepID=UPI0038263C23
MSAHGDHDLGHTVAGWTGTAIGVLGGAVLGVAVIATSAALLWLGLGVLVLAGAACWALHLAGWGKPTGPRPRSAQDWRSRDTAARHGHPGCLGCRMAGRGGHPAAGSAQDPVPPHSGRSLPGARMRAGSA